MGRAYREIRLSHGVTTDSIDVRLVNERTFREDLHIIRQAVNGRRYEFWTGYRRRWIYTFTRTNSDVFSFFHDAYDAHHEGDQVTFSIERDDGSFEDVPVIVIRPRYQDDTVSDTGKYYESIEVELLEI